MPEKSASSELYDVTDDLDAEAENITLPRIDEASAVPKPAEIGKPWVGKEYDKLKVEQADLWESRGVAAARPSSIRAQGLKTAATAAAAELEGNQEVLVEARDYLKRARKVLSPLVRRQPYAKFWYGLRWGGLVCGDIAAISGAAIMRGEIVSLAVLQAVAVGIAAVTAGVIGEDIRDMRLARKRQRDPESLSAAEEEFADLFKGVDVGEKIVKLMIFVAVAVAVLTAGGIFALRSDREGMMNGVIFAALALAICFASGLNTYVYSDEAADRLDTADRVYAKELKRHRQLSERSALRQFAEATAEEESIKTEHKALGRAARGRMKALKFKIFRQNPGVVGHGPASSAESPLFAIPDGARPNGVRGGKAGG